jgi:2-dehydro-3-deoxyphosphogluconate aldolase/(4S)-4-hydroxy-2-oxoglutarate aldolase
VEVGIVPFVRGSLAKQALVAIEAVDAGRISIVEVTMAVPGAIEVIEQLSKSIGKDVWMGATRSRQAPGVGSTGETIVP